MIKGIRVEASPDHLLVAISDGRDEFRQTFELDSHGGARVDIPGLLRQAADTIDLLKQRAATKGVDTTEAPDLVLRVRV